MKEILTDADLRHHQGQHLNTIGSRDAQIASCIKAGRAIEQAVLQSPEIQALRDLLRETRQQLPLAAQFWNEDDEPERGSRNVARVMELIAKIDAAMEKQP